MGDVLTLVVLALPIIGIWLLVIKPAQRRARATEQLTAGLQVGQHVMTGGGFTAPSPTSTTTRCI